LADSCRAILSLPYRSHRFFDALFPLSDLRPIMTDVPDRFVRAFEAHEAFERAGSEAFGLTTMRLDARVTAAETDDWDLRYTLTVRAPMLSTAVVGEAVGSAVEDGWFDTYELRLEDAAGAVRQDVDVEEYTVEERDGEAVATFEFEWGNADRAPDIAKAIAEYAEGTYVEGVVPGYEYGPPVSDLLSSARQSDEGEGSSGPMPL
jgi:hypothetical protein